MAGRPWRGPSMSDLFGEEVCAVGLVPAPGVSAEDDIAGPGSEVDPDAVPDGVTRVLHHT